MCRIFRNSNHEENLIDEEKKVDLNNSNFEKIIYLELLSTCLGYINQKVKIKRIINF